MQKLRRALAVVFFLLVIAFLLSGVSAVRMDRNIGLLSERAYMHVRQTERSLYSDVVEPAVAKVSALTSGDAPDIAALPGILSEAASDYAEDGRLYINAVKHAWKALSGR